MLAVELEFVTTGGATVAPLDLSGEEEVAVVVVVKLLFGFIVPFVVDGVKVGVTDFCDLL